MLHYTTLPVTAFSQNCTILWCDETQEGVIVDPGGDVDKIGQTLTRSAIDPVRILLTHAHLDHVGGSVELARRYALPILGPHIDDRFWLEGLPQQCAMFGFPETPVFMPDQWLSEGDTITFGQEKLEVRHCPGHTPGHIIFFHAAARLAMVGDVLFKGSIGRTDFPRGDYQQLIRSIRERLFTLGDDVTFIPGHGPESTFGEERRHNPFVRDG